MPSYDLIQSVSYVNVSLVTVPCKLLIAPLSGSYVCSYIVVRPWNKSLKLKTFITYCATCTAVCVCHFAKIPPIQSSSAGRVWPNDRFTLGQMCSRNAQTQLKHGTPHATSINNTIDTFCIISLSDLILMMMSCPVDNILFSQTSVKCCLPCQK